MSDRSSFLSEQRESGSYEIRVRGHLDPRWATRLGVPDLNQDHDGTTALRGISVDQPALDGLLQRLRDLGLTLISVTRTGPDQPRNPLPLSTRSRSPK